MMQAPVEGGACFRREPCSQTAALGQTGPHCISRELIHRLHMFAYDLLKLTRRTVLVAAANWRGRRGDELHL